jgi:hypothetical protein
MLDYVRGTSVSRQIFPLHSCFSGQINDRFDSIVDPRSLEDKASSGLRYIINSPLEALGEVRNCQVSDLGILKISKGLEYLGDYQYTNPGLCDLGVYVIPKE